MPLFHVSKEEWLIANTELSKKLPGTKLRKKLSGLAHSFIKFKNKIIAIGKKIGAGSYGVVKQGQDELEHSYAIKAQGGPITDDDREEETIGEEMDFAYDMVERILDKPKTFYENTHHKLTTNIQKYSLLKYLEGNDLVFEIYDKDAYQNEDLLVRIDKLTTVQKLIIAIQVCQLLKQMQKRRIIHADLKPENLKIVIHGNKITVYLMDFGFSMHLPPGKGFITSDAKGTPGYIAPEILNTLFPGLSELKFSFESDIYAIGVMFGNDFELESHFFEGMTKIDPSHREKVDVTIARLLSALEASNHLDKDALDFIMSIKKQNGSSAKPIQKLGGYINPEQMKDVSLKPAARPNKPVATVLPNPANDVKLRPAAIPVKVTAPIEQTPMPVLRQAPKAQKDKILAPRAAIPLPVPSAAQAASPPPTAAAKHATKATQTTAPRTILVQKGKVPPPHRMLPVLHKEAQLQTHTLKAPDTVVKHAPHTVNPKLHAQMPTQKAEMAKYRPDAQVAPSMRKRMIVVLPGQNTELVSKAKANLLLAFENQAQKQDAFVPKGGVYTPLSKAIKVK